MPGDFAARGLNPAVAGYAPGRSATVHHLRKHGFTDTEILAAGLARTDDRGQLFDFFRNRATLPYTDPDGQVLGFITRTPAADTNPSNPKYLNSAETILFHKTCTPYGLDPETAAALRAGADLILVEGPLDAIAINTASHRQGVVAVATGGTALTPGQLTTLDAVAPLTDRHIVVVMDNDPAGHAAAVKAHTVLTAAGITHPTTVQPLPVKDAAQLLQEHGPDALRCAVTDRRPLQDLVIDHILDRWPNPNNWVEPRIHALNNAAPVIAHMPADQQHRQTLRVAHKLNLDLITVIDSVDEHRPPPVHAADPLMPVGLDLPNPPPLTSTRSIRLTTTRAAATTPEAPVPVTNPAPAAATPTIAADTQAGRTPLPTTAPEPSGHHPGGATARRETAERQHDGDQTAAPRAGKHLHNRTAEHAGQDLPDDELAAEITRLTAEQRETEAAAARALAYHRVTAADVAAGAGPAICQLHAVDAAHREKVAAIEAYRAAIQNVVAARAAAVATAVEIADIEAELAAIGNRHRHRRAQLASRLEYLAPIKAERDAAFATAAQFANPLREAAGHPDTHETAARAARQHRDNLPALRHRAREADQAAVEATRRRADQFAGAAADTALRITNLAAEQDHRAAYPDPTAERERSHEYDGVRNVDAIPDQRNAELRAESPSVARLGIDR